MTALPVNSTVETTPGRSGDKRVMNWKTIRLELACTETFPRGSAGRVFLLRVPVASDGHIDRAAIDRNPGRATVRRFWGSEPDCFGFVEPRENRWALKCGKAPGDEFTFLLDARPLKPGLQVKVRQPDGSELPFLIVNVKSIAAAS